MEYLDAVLVGIVTFNPDLQRLKDNINAVLVQAKHILIVDNGSDNFEDIERLFSDDITIIKNAKNQGIAKALRQIMEFGNKQGYIWVLTLDQDSIICSSLVKEYCKYVCRDDLQDVGMFTCLIKDRNFNDEKYEKQDTDVLEVPYCITSAAFTNVKKYFMTKGYDEKFFIDAVDFDICYSLREIGYRICRINMMGLYHEVGHGENRKFLWKEIVVYNHSPFRIYYMARNTVFMNRKHKNLFPWYMMIKKELTLLARILLYENCKQEKFNQFIKGLKAAWDRTGIV